MLRIALEQKPSIIPNKARSPWFRVKGFHFVDQGMPRPDFESKPSYFRTREAPARHRVGASHVFGQEMLRRRLLKRSGCFFKTRIFLRLIFVLALQVHDSDERHPPLLLHELRRCSGVAGPQRGASVSIKKTSLDTQVTAATKTKESEERGLETKIAACDEEKGVQANMHDTKEDLQRQGRHEEELQPLLRGFERTSPDIRT